MKKREANAIWALPMLGRWLDTLPARLSRCGNWQACHLLSHQWGAKVQHTNIWVKSFLHSPLWQMCWTCLQTSMPVNPAPLAINAVPQYTRFIMWNPLLLLDIKQGDPRGFRIRRKTRRGQLSIGVKCNIRKDVPEAWISGEKPVCRLGNPIQQVRLSKCQQVFWVSCFYHEQLQKSDSLPTPLALSLSF